MAFEQVDIRTVQTTRDYGPVRLAVYRTERQVKDGKHYISWAVEVTVEEPVYTRLGWSPGKSRIVVLEGTGHDSGLLQLRPGDEGAAFTVREGSRGKPPQGVIRINTARLKHHKIRELQVRSSPVTHQAFGSTLTVMVADIVELDQIRQ